MSLLQTTISRGPTVLVSAQNGSRDFTSAIQGVLERIPPNNSRLTYVWEQYLIHCECLLSLAEVSVRGRAGRRRSGLSGGGRRR